MADGVFRAVLKHPAAVAGIGTPDGRTNPSGRAEGVHAREVSGRGERARTSGTRQIRGCTVVMGGQGPLLDLTRTA
jgi:hypothetical protein